MEESQEFRAPPGESPQCPLGNSIATLWFSSLPTLEPDTYFPGAANIHSLACASRTEQVNSVIYVGIVPPGPLFEVETVPFSLFHDIYDRFNFT